MKTYVRIIAGRNRGSIGWIAGTLADRETKGITRVFVNTNLPYPRDFGTNLVRNLRELNEMETELFLSSNLPA